MRIALGVSGGIAAYKAAEVVRLLQQEGVDVQVVMTRAATEFITPLTFAALTGQKVITGLFGDDSGKPGNIESAIEHMAVAQRIDLLLVAPATAGILGRFAGGIANDFLTTLYLATKAPVIVAPAMNINMWEHPATQRNLATLRERGVVVVEPEAGYLACGMTGSGRLAAETEIVRAVCEKLGLKHDLDGVKVLVTAGPTCEDIDPVRCLTNRSSGKMGFAVAEAARRRGGRVTLISGPTNLRASQDVEWLQVRTAEQMERAVLEQSRDAEIVVMVAAVSDYRPAAAASRKMKRGDGPTAVELEPTADILAGVARDRADRATKRIIVGFAAETEDLSTHARAKLRTKNVDMIVANDVTQPGAGFDADTNIATLFLRDGAEISLPLMPKIELADRILDQIAKLRMNGRS